MGLRVLSRSLIALSLLAQMSGCGDHGSTSSIDPNPISLVGTQTGNGIIKELFLLLNGDQIQETVDLNIETGNFLCEVGLSTPLDITQSLEIHFVLVTDSMSVEFLPTGLNEISLLQVRSYLESNDIERGHFYCQAQILNQTLEVIEETSSAAINIKANPLAQGIGNSPAGHGTGFGNVKGKN